MSVREIREGFLDSERLFLEFLPQWSIEDSEYGVVTASDDAYFYGLQLLIETIRGKIHCTVVDIGLNKYQVYWLSNQPGITVVDYKPHVREQAKGTSWQKPWWIDLAPYKYRLWLDADCIVVNDLTPVFEKIKQQPLIMGHPMKKKAPIQVTNAYFRLNKLRTPLGKNPVQAGVMGLCLEREDDQTLMAAWKKVIIRCMNEPSTRKHIKYWDEGALFVAVQDVNFDRYVVTDQLGWDRFISFRHSYSHEDFYKRLTIRDEDVIIHVVGKKPWHNWVWRPYP